VDDVDDGVDTARSFDRTASSVASRHLCTYWDVQNEMIEE
jgi:hypothetical protein